MNAADVIEAYQRLSKAEKGIVVQFIHEQERAEDNQLSEAQVLAAAEDVFREHAELFRKLAQ